MSCVLVLFSTGVGLVFPLGMQRLVDAVFVAGDLRLLNLVAGGLLLLFVVQAVVGFWQSYLVASTGERMGTDLNVRLVDHLLRLSLRDLDARRTGELMSVVIADAALVRSGTLDTALPLVSQVLTLAGSVAFATYLNWRLALVVLVVAPLTAGLATIVGRRVRAATSLGQEEVAQASAVLNEALSSVRVVKAFDREAYESGRFRERIAEVLRLSLVRVRIQSTLGPALTLLTFCAVTAVVWFGGREVLEGRLTVGELVAFLVYLVLVAGPIGALGRLWTQLQQALGAAQRVFGLLDTPLGIVDAPDAVALPPASGRFAFEAVDFAYAPDRPVLRGVTFGAEPGQTVALVGPSGAGKSTAVALLLRLYDVTGGRVVVDGHDVRRLTQSSLRAAMAVVPQEPVLFGTSVAENVRYGRPGASDADVERAVRAANAHEFVAALPEGYGTPVGERGVQLSAGQRQRIAIARALLKDAPVLLLDEATASLDNESEFLVQEALARLMRGRTTLVIAHRLTTVESADRIVVLEAGRVAEQGTPAELVAAGGLYHRLLTRAFAT